jgi:hypothetical protein
MRASRYLPPTAPCSEDRRMAPHVAITDLPQTPSCNPFTPSKLGCSSKTASAKPPCPLATEAIRDQLEAVPLSVFDHRPRAPRRELLDRLRRGDRIELGTPGTPGSNRAHENPPSSPRSTECPGGGGDGTPGLTVIPLEIRAFVTMLIRPSKITTHWLPLRFTIPCATSPGYRVGGPFGVATQTTQVASPRL